MKLLAFTLGEQIQIVRQESNLTQKQLATKLNICQTVISQVETGQRELAHSEILLYAKALNVHPLILLNTIPNNGCRTGKVRNKHRG